MRPLIASLAAFVLTVSGCAYFQARSHQASTQYENPVINHDFPDPMVLHAADGYYYAYATQAIAPTGAVNIQMARSRDLVHWDNLGDALPVKPSWANKTQNFWAPHVQEDHGTYYMYYSAEPNGGGGLALAVATSHSPAGPFVDSGKPLLKGPGFENIDPCAFDDPATGKHLLFWGSGFKPIKVRELADDRVSFKPGSQAKELIRPSDKPYESLVEGAFVIKRGAWYYMFYSGDNCCGERAHYAPLVARSRQADGPYEKLADQPGMASGAVLEANDRWNAPGHNAVVTDGAGQDWIVYHAIDRKWTEGHKDAATRRPMLIDRLTYANGWPRVEDGSPSSHPQSAPVP